MTRHRLRLLMLGMTLSLVLAMANNGQGGSAQGQEWQETSCPPTQPFTFCTFKDHTIDVGFFAIAFSPDGKLLATTDDEAEPTQGLIRLWDASQGTVIRTITSVCCPLDIAFSPDGKLLASATGTVFNGGDNSVKLWDIATGKLVRQLTGHTQLLNQVAFSPDGKTLASSSKDNTIRLWDPATGATLRTITPAGPAFAFNPDGKALAAGVCTRRGGHGECVQGLITLSDLATGQEIRSFQVSLTSGVSLVAFSPDGKSLATASGDSTDPTCGQGTSVINLWDVATGNLIRTFSFGCPYDPKDPLAAPYETGLLFSPDGSVVVGGAYVGYKLWKVASGSELRYLTGVSGIATFKGAAFSPDGKLLALAFVDKRQPGLRVFYVGDLTTR